MHHLNAYRSNEECRNVFTCMNHSYDHRESAFDTLKMPNPI